MQVKVFKAQDIRSALEKVKAELGPEALILSTRTIQKNAFGFSGKPGIEVTAAVDGSLGSEGSPTEQNSTNQQGAQRDTRAGHTLEKGQTYSKNGHFQQVLEEREQPPKHQSSHGADPNLYQELQEMKQSFQGLVQEFSKVKGKWTQQGPGSGSGLVDPDIGHADFGNRVLQELSACGLGTEFLNLLFEAQKKNMEYAAREGPDNIDAHLEKFLSEMITVKDPLAGAWTGQKRLCFIGPTGVGKTTTLAKVAANFLLGGGKRILLATIDNYRIAAVEQLKIYGQIMNVPVEVARSPEQLQEIFLRHRDKDLILVDTAGRNPKDEVSQEELAAFLDPGLRTENHLVLSSTTGQSDLCAVVERFEHLTLHGLVFTKLDECDLLGRILNVQIQAGYPLSFLTNGQKVPEDLLPPEARQLAGMILTTKRAGKGLSGNWSGGSDLIDSKYSKEYIRLFQEARNRGHDGS